MKADLAYLKYLARHKWFVLQEGLKLGVPTWRLLVHDWDKLLPWVWIAYRDTFYDERGRKQYKSTADFDYAWLSHQHRNKHHWQHWVLRGDTHGERPLQIPEEHLMEMVADWRGASRANGGNVVAWYAENKHKITLHHLTAQRVEQLMV